MTTTAAALAQAVPEKTVVLTGAMIPYAFGSSDGLFIARASAVQALPPELRGLTVKAGTAPKKGAKEVRR